MRPQERRAFSKALLFCLAMGSGITPAAAQELAIPAVTYPKLPKQAETAEGFVPQGWILEAQATGDLNRDGIDDLALVVRRNDPRNVIANDGLGENPFDTNPRILAVAFRKGPSGEYVLKAENHTLIPRRENPSQEDPFEEGISIERGGLRVILHMFMTAGGWEMFTATHTFQYRNGRFELIGYDRSSIHRASGETRDISINYLTGKMEISTGDISSDNPMKATRKAVQRRVPLTLEMVGDGLDFDPER